MEIREGGAEDRDWIERVLVESWGATVVVSHGLSMDALELPALLAWEGGERVGLATYRFAGRACEVVTLDAVVRWRGVGSALLARIAAEARAHGCRRVWLITSNDNLDAIRFYQRRRRRSGAPLEAVDSGDRRPWDPGPRRARVRAPARLSDQECNVLPGVREQRCVAVMARAGGQRRASPDRRPTPVRSARTATAAPARRPLRTGTPSAPPARADRPLAARRS